jgi:hypothetical protein
MTEILGVTPKLESSGWIEVIAAAALNAVGGPLVDSMLPATNPIVGIAEMAGGAFIQNKGGMAGKIVGTALTFHGAQGVANFALGMVGGIGGSGGAATGGESW